MYKNATLSTLRISLICLRKAIFRITIKSMKNNFCLLSNYLSKISNAKITITKTIRTFGQWCTCYKVFTVV